MDVLWALLLIGLAAFVGGIVLRRVPGSWLVIGAVIVVFGLGIPALVIDDNKESGGGGEAAATSGGEEASGEEAGGGKAGGGESGGGGGETASAEGKLVFQQSCGTCHTLSDAGTSGQIGPSLDQLTPNAAQVQAAIKNGGSGSGTMPAAIIAGAEAKQVADYVASVAGK